MNTSLLPRGPVDGDIFAHIAESLYTTGYCILSDVFPVAYLQGLFIDIKNTDSRQFHYAGIGREQGFQLNQFVRRDRICWLEQDHGRADFYFEWMEKLRLYVNRRLFLGLFDYECHYAHYPEGAFYKKHYDSFQGSSNRRLTTILYLNPDWQPGDGGQLLMYAKDGETVLETVQPTFGTLVIFLSEEFPHEVVTAKRSRYSLTGWFRINNNSGVTLDPGA